MLKVADQALQTETSEVQLKPAERAADAVSDFQQLKARHEELEEQLQAEKWFRWAAEADRDKVAAVHSTMLEELEILRASVTATKVKLLTSTAEREAVFLQDSEDSILTTMEEDSTNFAAPVEPSAVVQLQARARILQDENLSLREEAATKRRRARELQEGLEMAAEDSRSKRVEDAALMCLLKLQLEESRRARSIELNSLVKKLCHEPPKAAAQAPMSSGLHTVSVMQAVYSYSRGHSVVIRQHHPGGC